MLSYFWQSDRNATAEVILLFFCSFFLNVTRSSLAEKHLDFMINSHSFFSDLELKVARQVFGFGFAIFDLSGSSLAENNLSGIKFLVYLYISPFQLFFCLKIKIPRRWDAAAATTAWMDGAKRKSLFLNLTLKTTLGGAVWRSSCFAQ